MGGGELFESRKAARVTLDCDDPVGAGCKQCACQSAGTGADLDDCRMLEPTSGARDPSRQIEVEQEVLAEASACGDAVPGDDLAQRRRWWRSGVAGQPAAVRLAAISPAIRSAAIRLSGRAVPWPAIAKAVP